MLLFHFHPIQLNSCALSSSVQVLVILQYSPVNIQGPGCPVDPSEVTLPGCSCVSHSCITESCCCLQTHGQAYAGNGTLRRISVSDVGHFTPVFECNALCSCSDTCSNRVVQRGLILSLQICTTARSGWGVRTLQRIPHGTFVCEYAGEVIGFEEARRRQLAQRFEDNNYIIAVREHAGTGSITETFVDPATVGNIGRFLNHSCLPNLFMVPVRVHSLVPRLALFAGRDIDVQEELTFDYSGGYTNQTPGQLHCTQTDTAIQASKTVQRKTCHCGANNCAKFLPLDLSILK
ncbi:histone-lysine N-methyltransferase SETMAR isoform X2 [Phyllopteryx taeniolatus]|uniref:histone-lysine N-methyltransferase SETMAR isoform X2 n=1 Tax=Phyllopteryx taeniolatus TaxID=161469 RepID=UPI002AD350A8|nr:histone-lysine N-methyltransferase SETMAR isoform X2 [Phyllopteryx taeniolatus]